MKSDRDLLLVSLFTCITVFLWIFFDLIKTTKTSTVPTSVQQLITPLTPAIDTDTLTVLEQRTTVQ